jgi:EmrB/QacA subfamily drug resistance transporter
MTDTNTGQATAPPRTERGGAAVLVAVALASLMVPLAVTGPALALTSMATDLAAGVEGVQWVLNAYNVTFAASLLAAGGIADRIGRRRVLVAGTAVYAAMSLVTAVSTSILVVDLARAVQGIGSAGILTAGAAILAATFDGPARARAFGVLGTAFGAGLALGPLLAGVLVDLAGWRSVFLLNLLIAAVVLALCPRVPESRTPTTGPVDWGGAATFSIGLFLMALGFVQGPVSGWGSPLTIGAFVGAALFVALFVVAEKRAVNPTFDLSLFRRPSFVAVMSQPFTIVFGFVILVVFLPPYLQGVDGYSASAAGALLLPLMVPVFLLPVLVGRFAAKVPLRYLLATSSLLIAAGSLWLLTLEPGMGPVALAGPLLVFGLGVGSAFGVMDNAAVSSVPVEQAASAAGMFNTIRITGESVAVAAAAALLGSVTLAGLRDAGPGLAPGQAEAIAGQSAQGRIAEAVAGVPAGQQDGVLTAAVDGVTTALHVAFGGIAALALAGAIVTLLLLREAPAPAEESA